MQGKHSLVNALPALIRVFDTGVGQHPQAVGDFAQSALDDLNEFKGVITFLKKGDNLTLFREFVRSRRLVDVPHGGVINANDTRL